MRTQEFVSNLEKESLSKEEIDGAISKFDNAKRKRIYKAFIDEVLGDTSRKYTLELAVKHSQGSVDFVKLIAKNMRHDKKFSESYDYKKKEGGSISAGKIAFDKAFEVGYYMLAMMLWRETTDCDAKDLVSMLKKVLRSSEDFETSEFVKCIDMLDSDTRAKFCKELDGLAGDNENHIDLIIQYFTAPEVVFAALKRERKVKEHINKKDGRGETLLFKVLSAKDVILAKRLVACGADIDAFLKEPIEMLDEYSKAIDKLNKSIKKTNKVICEKKLGKEISLIKKPDVTKENFASMERKLGKLLGHGNAADSRGSRLLEGFFQSYLEVQTSLAKLEKLYQRKLGKFQKKVEDICSEFEAAAELIGHVKEAGLAPSAPPPDDELMTRPPAFNPGSGLSSTSPSSPRMFVLPQIQPSVEGVGDIPGESLTSSNS